MLIDLTFKKFSSHLLKLSSRNRNVGEIEFEIRKELIFALLIFLVEFNGKPLKRIVFEEDTLLIDSALIPVGERNRRIFMSLIIFPIVLF
jgi:hypothetical protein